MTIGEKIRALREEKKMLQKELAAMLNVGEGYLSKIEKDKKNIKREHLKTISKIFKCQYNELETLWIAAKVYELIKFEKGGLKALKVAEEQIKHNRTYAKV